MIKDICENPTFNILNSEALNISGARDLEKGKGYSSLLSLVFNTVVEVLINVIIKLKEIKKHSNQKGKSKTDSILINMII